MGTNTSSLRLTSREVADFMRNFGEANIILDVIVFVLEQTFDNISYTNSLADVGIVAE